MAHDNVEIVRRALEAYNEHGVGAPETMVFFDPAAVFEEPREQPGSTVAEGREAAAETFAQFDEQWDEHRSEPREIRPVDDERVLLLSMEHFRGRDGLELTQPSATLFTLRNGLVVRMQSFWDQHAALEAAGLADSAG